MVIDDVTFDKELWQSTKSNFEIFYKYFFLNLYFSEDRFVIRRKPF